MSLTAQLDQTITARPVSPVLPHKDGMELNVLIDAIAERYGTSPHRHVFAQAVNSGTDMHVLSVQMVEHGALTLNHVNAQYLQHGMVLHVLYAQVVEFTTTLPTNASAPVVNHITATSALSTAQLANSITKLLRNVFVQEVNSGTEISVFIAMVDKHGTQPLTLVLAPQEASGTDTHVSIHVQVEEFLMLLVANVSAQLVTGMVLLVLFAQILKYGQLQDWLVSAPMETGTVKLVSNVQRIKFGSQLQ